MNLYVLPLSLSIFSIHELVPNKYMKTYQLSGYFKTEQTNILTLPVSWFQLRWS